MNSLLQTLRALGPVRLAALGGVAIATLLFLIFISTQMNSAGMSPVYSGLSPQDGGAIIARLEQLNIPYEASADGTRVSVPGDQAGRVKMMLAQEGLPAGGGVGYEIFNKPEGFGSTTFLQNLNQQRALEGEIARSIRNIRQVAGARVQLVLPRRELFSRDSEQARASVFLELRGTLEREQISAIQHLVASAVPKLDPERVAIVDSRGRLLAAGTGSDSISAQQASAEEQRMAIEQRLAQRVEEILGRTVGFEKVRAEVTVELDMDSITTQSETFDPESQVARSTQSVNEKDQTNEPTVSTDAPVSVNTSLPSGDAPGSASKAAAASTPTSQKSRSEETTNFEISKTVQNQVRNPGAIRRLSVAVLIDGVTATEGTGAEAKEVYTPRSQADLDKYAALVRSAVGYDANRGDVVEVSNLQFAKVEEVKADVLSNLTNNPQIMNLAQIVVMGLLALLVLLLVVRPLVKNLLDVKPVEDRLLAGAGETPQLAPPAGSALSEQLDAEAAAAAEEAADSMIDITRVDGRVKASSLKKMGEIIEKHPEEAVAIIRQWIYAES